MQNKIKLNSLHQQLQTQKTNINSYYTKNVQLQSNYDAGISRIKQLERELIDVLHYKKNIMKNMEVVESCASGHSSRLGRIKIARRGQLEGHFFERMQSRLDGRQSKQSDAVESIKENIRKIKSKSEVIEDEIESARKYAMEIDGLISANQANIQAKKIQIAQLQGSIRMMT